MRDGFALGALKRLVRALWTLELGIRRRAAAIREKPRYALAGSCEGCAKCCEAPSIHVGWLTWHFPTPQRLFLFWQYVVNGFEYVRKEREGHVFVFRCSHFDVSTRRCDSYETRPHMCRDYPRLLLEQPWPEFFEGCGYRALDTQGARLREAIGAAELPEAKKDELRRRLHIYEDSPAPGPDDTKGDE